MARPRATVRFRAAYGRLLEWLVIALMVGLAVEVTLGVIFRSIGQAVSWYDEVASILLASGANDGLRHKLKLRGHLRRSVIFCT